MKLKLFALLCLVFSSVQMATAQERRTELKSDVVLSKSDATKEVVYPKISVNENRCRFDRLLLGTDENGRHQLTFHFGNICDGHRNVALSFNSLQDAVMVKDLVMNNTDYDIFNMKVDKVVPPRYEFVYVKER
ncbi:MAG: hypothetical protein EA392_09050 [Cryomorphaceae bacterium]|nr:MAG: hypothetical protein EA392_09050 [Cryomorphaceae bacterium]